MALKHMRRPIARLAEGLQRWARVPRLAEGLQRWARVLRHRGDAVACPVCGHSFDTFAPDRGRPGVVCWRCGARERHRALWLYLERRPELLASARSLLHFAPEWCLEQRLRRVSGLRYRTADLRPGAAELEIDITAIALPDASFDAILCSHVLEHVEDDAAAIRELHRVLAPGGWAIVMVPLDLTRSRTLEDPTIRTAADRERVFWQADHVRLYAPDLAERLERGGFAVSREPWVRELPAADKRRYGLLDVDEIFLCRK